MDYSIAQRQHHYVLSAKILDDGGARLNVSNIVVIIDARIYCAVGDKHHKAIL